MRYRIAKDTDAPVDNQITKVLISMDVYGVDAPEYPELLTKLERLSELKVKTRREPVSPDTMVMVFGNFAVALLIVAYEQKHVLTSKAISQISKLRT